jgi:hypothetical protein
MVAPVAEKPILPDSAYRDSWKVRAVRETGGNKTLMGCFVLAILNLQHGVKPPRFGSRAVINAEGLVFSNMQAADGTKHPNHCLGPVQVITDNFRGLADHLELSDKDRVAMFAELKKWFVHDARANQSNEERGLSNGEGH